MVTKVTVIGIDPGTRRVGYGVVVADGKRWRAKESGVIRLSSRFPLPHRLTSLFNDLEALLEEHRPNWVAVEEPYVRPFGMRSALTVAQSVGVIKVAATKAGVFVVSYPYTQVKRTLTGNGNASRSLLASVVQRFLRLPDLPPWDDAIDALAFALCHFLLAEKEGMKAP